VNRRSLLRAFLALPVAARFAPFVRPAPLSVVAWHQRMTEAGYEWIRLDSSDAEWRAWRERQHAPVPTFSVSMG
jgi:hypothetical protein